MRPLVQRLVLAGRLRCPLCWSAPMFGAPWRMHERCPGCGWRFDQGRGYFVGAMYASYALSLALGCAVALVAWWATAQIGATVGAAAIAVGVAGPLAIFPYSRLLWVWVERDGWLHDGEEDPAILRARHLERGAKAPPAPVTVTRAGPPPANDDDAEPPAIA